MEIIIQLRAMGFKRPREEYMFHPNRKWRFDYAWLDEMVALEIEGGTWSGRKMGHTSGKGYEKDCHKYNEAALRGWTVVRVTYTMIKDGSAIGYITRALQSRSLPIRPPNNQGATVK